MQFQELIKYESFQFRPKVDVYLDHPDTHFKNYMELINGGYYFNNAIHIYSIQAKDAWNDIYFVNNVINKYYLDIVGELFAFSEDIFGNQFAFHKNGIVYLNIESGSYELIAEDYREWILVLISDRDFLSGWSLTIEMNDLEKEKLRSGFRLCPKIPFVSGGNYDSQNLYFNFWDKNIAYNSSIAHQVINLKDGQKIRLVIDKTGM